MMGYWKYSGITPQGQEISGVIKGNKESVLGYLKNNKIDVIIVYMDWVRSFLQLKRAKRISIKIMSGFFEDMANMHETGMSINQILASVSSVQLSAVLMGAIEGIKSEVSKGKGLADAFASTKSFPWIVTVTIKSGEQSGELKGSLRMLAHYFKRQEEVSGRLREALVYPSIVFCLLCAVMLFVGVYVVPRLAQLLPESTRVHGTTGVIIAATLWLRQYGALLVLIIGAVLVSVAGFIFNNKRIREFVVYRLPIWGRINKEADLAYYFLNLSILMRNGTSIIKGIDDLHANNNNAVSGHFYGCRDYIFGGGTLWESLGADRFFSPLIVMTIRRGEEMARLPQYCLNLSEYLNKRVNEQIDRAVILLQPALLIIGAVFLVTIAFAFLIPVYGSLNQIAGG